MNKFLLALLVSALPVLASANTLSFVSGNSTGTTNISITGYGSSIAATGNVTTGKFGTFYTEGTGNGTLTATFLGESSGYNNFYFDANNILAEYGSSISSVIDGSGQVVFGFGTDGLGSTGTFTNGSDAGDVIGFALLDVSPESPAYSLYQYIVGFNDGYPGDADYNDYVVGLNYATTVPVPASLPLMVSALGLFGFGVSRKRSAK